MRFGCPFGPSDIGRNYPPKELDVVELKLDSFDTLASYHRNPSAVKAQLKDKEIVVHAPWQYDLAAPTREARDEAVKLYNQCIDLCSTFNSGIMIAHPSQWHVERLHYEGNVTRNQIFSWLRETVPQVNDYARSSGVTLALENLPSSLALDEKCVGHYANDFTSFVKEMNCSMCFDVSHAAHDLGSFLKHEPLFVMVHICDTVIPKGLDHLFLGDGEIDWNKYSSRLLAMDLPSIFEFDRTAYSDEDFVRGKEFMLQASQAPRQ